MYNLAVCYGKGRGLPSVDRVEALRWAHEALNVREPDNNDRSIFADSTRIGIGMAHTMLGNWHYKGIELEKDNKLALHHWHEG